MTAKEALKISVQNADKEVNEVLRMIEQAAKQGKVKIVLDFDVNSISKLLDLGYDHSYYSGPEGIKTTISWANGRDNRRQEYDYV